MRRIVSAFVLMALAACSTAAPQPRRLVACADPNNLPFSNQAQQGFENRLAELIARDLHAQLGYVWWAQRRGYVRNTLNQGRCDFWPGVGSGVEMVSTTRPYYRSTYVFVTRAADNLQGLTLDDPRLRRLRIGVQMVGNDGMNTPPAHALSRRGIIRNVHGYMLYGDYTRPNPAADAIGALERGEVDVALIWGPFAGYFATHSNTPLRLERVTPWLDAMQWPMVYDVSVGVRRDNPALQHEIEQVLARQAPEIRRLLQAYHVPLVEQASG